MFDRKGKTFHMEDKVPQQSLHVKHAGLAVECGTLDVFLKGMTHQPVFLMPLQRQVPNQTQYVWQYAVHLTARPIATSPVSYCTFFAAQLLGFERNAVLTWPYKLGGAKTRERAVCLQQEMVQALTQLLTESARVSEVVQPARYRLPDEWVWSLRSVCPQIICREEHWEVMEVPHA